MQILPQNIGTSDYIITTANGKSLKLTVVVFRQLSTNDIIFTLKDTSSSNIASYENYTQGLAKDSLKNIVIKGKKDSAAQTYAENNGIKFLAVDEEITTEDFSENQEVAKSAIISCFRRLSHVFIDETSE